MADELDVPAPPPRWVVLLPWVFLWIVAPAPLWLALVLTFLTGMGR